MTIRWLLAAVHLLALGVGLGAVWARGRALQALLDVPALRRVFYADSWWGIAAVLWIDTGLVRAFGGYEKGGFGLSPQPPLLGEDGAARRDSAARARPDDRPDSLAGCRGSRGRADTRAAS